MKIIDTFPHRIREIENLFIPLPDGCRLAARVWLPETAIGSPVPAILEYIPYGKRSGTRLRDEPMHRYFAGHGYAAVRVDLRGSGDSDGVLLDEYLPQEIDDGVEVIRWLAEQPWCDGKVGLIGKSWGGINALAIAARRPPALGGVITVCSTDDRYADDAHYMGGCLLNENLIWGSAFLALAAEPPDPAVVGERWRQMWRQRLEALPLYPEIWLRHPFRDAYWRQGSASPGLAGIACPVYAVGGWADGYSNTVPRLLAGLPGAAKGLVGPWAHVYPHQGAPGPVIGFLQEALSFWDHCLRGVDTGFAATPRYRVWLQEHALLLSPYDRQPGRWVVEEEWPSRRLERRRWTLGPGRLTPAATGSPAAGGMLSHRSPASVGLAAGAWCGFPIDGALPSDQRPDDERSLVFDSAPLPERLEILGAPELELELAVDRPLAQLAARLADVAPDGSSCRVTYGLLNLTHRHGHERPRPLVPGERYRISLRLNDAGHSFAPGHRLRLALSTGYWPVAWPSPEPVTLSLFLGSSHLALPVRPPRPEDAGLPPFASPERAPMPEHEDLVPEYRCWTVESDLESGQTVATWTIDVTPEGEIARSRIEAIDLEIANGVVERFSIRDDDPLSAATEIVHRTLRRRRDWAIRVDTKTRMSATREAFHLEAEVTAYEGEEVFCSRVWRSAVPRRLV